MFEWTEESIRFRVDAAEQVGFDEAIAAHILPHLPENAHVCDAGCGLGYLSIALAAHCGAVTAVDTSGAALAVLRENAERLSVENLCIREADLFSMQPEEPYDAMVFCFFGQIGETLRAVRAQCSGRAVLVKRDHVSRRFSLTERPARRLNFQAACDELTELGVPFSAETFQSVGDPIADLTEDLAAEQKARLTYDNLLRLIDDPDVRDPIIFLREREIVHFQRFGEALGRVVDSLDRKNVYAFNPAFDPGANE